MAAIAGAGAAVFALAIVTQTLLASKSSPIAIASPTSIANSATNPPRSPAAGVAPVTRLLPVHIADPAAQCTPYEPPYPWQMPGLIQALACRDPGLPNGEVYAFQMRSSATFQLSWQNFNSWWGFDISRAGRNCPPAGGHGQGAHGFKTRDFPPRAGQVVECQAVSGRGGGSSTPAYAWALPSQDAFFVAQGADGSSFTALNAWWTNNALPAVSPRPQAS